MCECDHHESDATKRGISFDPKTPLGSKIPMRCKLGLHRKFIYYLIDEVHQGDMWDNGYSIYYKVLLCEDCSGEWKQEISHDEYLKLIDDYRTEYGRK